MSNAVDYDDDSDQEFPFDLIAERAARKEHVSFEEAMEKVEEAHAALWWRFDIPPRPARVLRLARLLIHPSRYFRRPIVHVTIEPITLMGGEWGTLPIASILVTCNECHRSVEAYGNGSESVRWACATLDDECGEGHWYEPEVDDV